LRLRSASTVRHRRLPRHRLLEPTCRHTCATCFQSIGFQELKDSCTSSLRPHTLVAQNRLQAHLLPENRVPYSRGGARQKKKNRPRGGLLPGNPFAKKPGCSVSICTFVPVNQVNWVPFAKKPGSAMRIGGWTRARQPAGVRQQRQYLYFCTSKASKLNTLSSGARQQCQLFSICTFVPTVKHVN